MKSEHPALLDGAVLEEPAQISADPADDFQRQKNEIERQIEITILEAKLARIKAQVAIPAPKSLREKLMESIEERNAKVLEMHVLKKELKEKNDIRFANDPELRERANKALDEWAEEQY